MYKTVPFGVRRFFRLIRADGRIASVFVEIKAVVSRMIKNAVQNNADAVRRGIADERVEIFQSTQKAGRFF